MLLCFHQKEVDKNLRAEMKVTQLPQEVPQILKSDEQKSMLQKMMQVKRYIWKDCYPSKEIDLHFFSARTSFLAN